MRSKRTVPLLLGAGTVVSGLVLIAANASAYIKSFDVVAAPPASGGRLIIGAGLIVFGLILAAIGMGRR